MTTPRKKAAAKAAPAPAHVPRAFCGLPPVEERTFAVDVSPGRARAILAVANKWVNGTVLNYYFFDQPTDGANVRLANGATEWRPWTTTEAEKNVVRQGFQRWRDLGIGLQFREVASRNEAQIRIGFQRGDGAWSYVGRDVLQQGPNDRTMNFGWSLTAHPQELDTAIHEIGHTLGLPHEHQNPFAGIVWDEEAVYAALAQPPNRWDRAKTFHNIIRKLPPDSVQGSQWDPDSVMHYPFEPGLIREPAQFRLRGIQPAGGLSARDREWIRTFYPPLQPADEVELKLMESVPLALEPGGQKNFVFRPTRTRQYTFRTFGASDTVMVLFEEENGQLRQIAADDDSGEAFNASLEQRLRKGRKYVLRVRLYYAEFAGETALMVW